MVVAHQHRETRNRSASRAEADADEKRLQDMKAKAWDDDFADEGERGRFVGELFDIGLRSLGRTCDVLESMVKENETYRKRSDRQMQQLRTAQAETQAMIDELINA